MLLASRPDVAPRWVINTSRILIWSWLLLVVTTFLPLKYEGPIATSFKLSRAADWRLLVLGMLCLIIVAFWGFVRVVAEKLRLGEIIGPECWNPDLAIRAGGHWREAEHLRRSLEQQYRIETGAADLGIRYSKVAQLPFTVRNRIFAPLWIATSQLREYVEVLLLHEREHIILGHHKLAWRYGQLAKLLPPLESLFAPMKLAMEAEADRRAYSKLQQNSSSEAAKYLEALRSVVDGSFQEEQKLELGHDARNVPARIHQAITGSSAPRFAISGIAILSLTLGCIRVLAGPISISEAFGFGWPRPPKAYTYRFWTGEASVKPILGQGGAFLDGINANTEKAELGTLALTIMPAVTRISRWRYSPDFPVVKVSFEYEAYPISSLASPNPSIEIEIDESRGKTAREQEIRPLDYCFRELLPGRGHFEAFLIDQDSRIDPKRKNSGVFDSMYIRVPAGWRFRLTNLYVNRGFGQKELRVGNIEEDITRCVTWRQRVRTQEPLPNLSWRQTTLGN
jgi:hypothetical protein